MDIERPCYYIISFENAISDINAIGLLNSSIYKIISVR